MLSLASGIVFIANGNDDDYWDGIDIDTIIDAVEYSRNSTHIKRNIYELDAGFAGIGVDSYSGRSIQRIKPGFDTDDSFIDFNILDKPTPGY